MGIVGRSAERIPKAVKRRHCKNVIPPPYVLEKRVETVRTKFQSMKDPDTTLPLFSFEVDATYELQKMHIGRGCL